MRPIAPLLLALTVPGFCSDISDTMTRFHGLCSITADGKITAGACRSEDLPQPGYINRFRITIQPLSGGMPISSGTHTVTVTALPDGSMLVATQRMSVVFIPMDRCIREEMAKASPGTETRKQTVSVSETHPGVYRIFIEEPSNQAMRD